MGSPAATRRAPAVADAATGLLAAGVAAAVALLAIRSLQLGVGAALLLLLAGVHRESRTAGLALLWALWLLTPALRRMLDLVVEAGQADPLTLVPLAGTGLLGLMELRRAQLSPSARRAAGLALAGLALGAPVGLLSDPVAFTFAATAYGCGVLAIVLGYVDAMEGRSTLVRALTVAAPLLAIYGICQYFLPLTTWDSAWVEGVDLRSIGSPEEDQIRVFSTLNSPGTLGAVIAVAVILMLAVARRSSTDLVLLIPVIVCLALTFVRSAWLGLVLALLIYAALARGRAAGRVLMTVAVCLALVVVVGGSHPTTRAFTERVTTLGDLQKDDSARERLQFTNELLPAALQQPLGAGLGQAGLALRLEESGDSGALTTTDNGYLAMLYQVGLGGFLLIVVAMFSAALAGFRALPPPGPERQQAAGLLAAFFLLLLLETSGDMLFGITGAILWYIAGCLFAARERASGASTS